MLRSSARELVLAALPAVDELRSTTARMAMLFFQVWCYMTCFFWNPQSGMRPHHECTSETLPLCKHFFTSDYDGCSQHETVMHICCSPAVLQLVLMLLARLMPRRPSPLL